MSSGYTFISHQLGSEYEVLYTAGAAAIILTALCALCGRRVVTNDNPLVPDRKFSIRFLGDFLCTFIMWLGDTVMGKENRKYLPFAATAFFYIFFLNIISLIPGIGAETGGRWPETFAFNLGIALTVFVFYHVMGVWELGPISYLKHFLGGPVFERGAMLIIGLMIASLELISHCIRPISLSLRLFGNITGDHLILGVFTDLTKFGVPLAFYALGTFVSFMQAFVFSMLTMVYIRFAVEHGHGDSGHERNH